MKGIAALLFLAVIASFVTMNTEAATLVGGREKDQGEQLLSAANTVPIDYQTAGDMDAQETFKRRYGGYYNYPRYHYQPYYYQQPHHGYYNNYAYNTPSWYYDDSD